MTSKIERLYRLFVFYTALFLFALGTLAYNIFCFLVCLIPGRTSRIGGFRKLNGAMLRALFWTIQVVGICKIHVPDPLRIKQMGASVLIANHTGLLDALLFNALFPQMTCVFKEKLTKNPCFSHALSAAGHISNAGGIDSIRTGAEEIKQGNKVLLFPEGTRREDQGDFEFKSGFALMAMRANVPVYLMAVHNPSKAYSKSQGIATPPKLPFEYRIEQIEKVEKNPQESTAAFVQSIEQTYTRYFNNDANLQQNLTT